MKLAPNHSARITLKWAPDDHQLVGRLAYQRGRILLELDPAFIAAPSPISPFTLPVAAGPQEGPRSPFQGLHGVFADSLPDGWGRLLLDRRALRQGLEPGALTPIDRLCCVGDAGIGALTYAPELLPGPQSRDIDLQALANEVDEVLDGTATDVLDELLRLGGSPHGARPKVLVSLRPADFHCVSGAPAVGHHPVLVKFPAPSDPDDVGAMELAYNRMARQAGIDVPECWLVPGGRGPGWFATRRFDTDGHTRIHVHTLCGLLHADHRIGSLDYSSALAAVHRLTGDLRAVEQMARRMAFNVFAHNRDDHTKQHALALDRSGTWTLAPAYDLTFSTGPGGEQSMTVAGNGRPTRDDLVQVADAAGLRQTKRLIDEVEAAVSDWRRHAEEVGVSAATIERISRGVAL